MKTIIQLKPAVDLERGNAFRFEVRWPARVVKVHTEAAEAERLIKKPRNLPADLTTLVTFFVECEADAPLVKKEILVYQLGAVVEEGFHFVDVQTTHEGKLVAVWESRPERPSAADDPSRCAVCGWQMADPVKGTAGFMCRPGDCSQRPLPTTLYAPARAEAEALARAKDEPLVAEVVSP